MAFAEGTIGKPDPGAREVQSVVNHRAFKKIDYALNRLNERLDELSISPQDKEAVCEAEKQPEFSPSAVDIWKSIPEVCTAISKRIDEIGQRLEDMFF